MILYKYIDQKYLKRFKEEGKLYVNTLYNLRICPNEPIRDELEGKFRVKVNPTNKPIFLSSEQAHKLFSNVTFDKTITENAITVMPNSSLVSDREISDAFIFCTSIALTNKLNNKFEYDSRFKITNPKLFADSLFEELSKKFNIVGYLANKVRYREKIRNITNQNKSFMLDNINQGLEEYCFKKPLNFKGEQEYRMIFLLGNETAIEPFEVTCPELLKYCVFM